MADTPPPGDRFVCMTLGQALEECSTPTTQDSFVRDAVCGCCKRKVFLHCSACKIQVTGCPCSEIERFGADKAWQNLVKQYGEEVTRQHYQNMGLWVPPSPGQN